MEKIKTQIKNRSIADKVELFEFLRDELNLKTQTEMSIAHGKSYGGANSFYKDHLHTRVSKTVYFVDNGTEA